MITAHLGWLPLEELVVPFAAAGSTLALGVGAALRRLRTKS